MSKTKIRIAHSLKELMFKKSLQQITIEDISSQTGITRQAFYYHFRDIYDLLLWTYEHELEDVLIQIHESKNPIPPLGEFFSYFYTHKEFTRKTFYAVDRDVLERILFKRLRPIIQSIMETVCIRIMLNKDPNFSEKIVIKHYIIDYFTFALVGTIIHWVQTNMQETPEDLTKRSAEILQQFTKGGDISLFLVKNT